MCTSDSHQNEKPVHRCRFVEAELQNMDRILSGRYALIQLVISIFTSFSGGILHVVYRYLLLNWSDSIMSIVHMSTRLVNFLNNRESNILRTSIFCILIQVSSGQLFLGNYVEL